MEDSSSGRDGNAGRVSKKKQGRPTVRRRLEDTSEIEERAGRTVRLTEWRGSPSGAAATASVSSAKQTKKHQK